MKTAAIFVFFNPDNDVTEQVLFVAKRVEQVFVLDNSDRRPSFQGELDGAPNIEYIRYGTNLGIARALNDGLERSLLHGHDQAFLFDQDSRCDADFISGMIGFSKERDSRAGICAPNFFDINAGTFARFTLLYKYKFSSFELAQKDPPTKSSFAITSGSIINLKTYVACGPLIDDLFIDYVDSEYCLRLQTMGWDTWINPKCILRHAIGRREVRSLLFLTVKPNNHTATRRYYIARNGVHVSKLYLRRYPAFSFLNFSRLAHELLSVIFFENEKLSKLKAIGYGVWDGLMGSLGPCERSF